MSVKQLKEESDRQYVKTMFSVFLYLLLTATATGAAIYVMFDESVLVIPFSFALGVIVAGPLFAYSTLLIFKK